MATVPGVKVERTPLVGRERWIGIIPTAASSAIAPGVTITIAAVAAVAPVSTAVVKSAIYNDRAAVVQAGQSATSGPAGPAAMPTVRMATVTATTIATITTTDAAIGDYTVLNRRRRIIAIYCTAVDAPTGDTIPIGRVSAGIPV